MYIVVFSKTEYLLRERKHYYKNLFRQFLASYKNIIVIPVSSKSTMNEERLNLLKTLGGSNMNVAIFDTKLKIYMFKV